MPYESVTELPAPVRDHLPPHAQEIFREAFNNAYERYKGDEGRSFKIAWAAVKHAGYQKDALSGCWNHR
ncbi:MAG: ChaB family protein [Cyanobacteria bacterium REEB65]|nr:ChaB family protein [Cyanobacteria bacterium REEB65]